MVSGSTGTMSLDRATGVKRRYPWCSNSVAISPDRKFLAMAASEEVLLWDLYNDQPYKPLNRLGGPVQEDSSLEFSPDGELLVLTNRTIDFGTPRAVLKVWRVSDWTEILAPTFQGRHWIPDTTFTPDSAYLVAVDESGIVRVWNTNTWELDRQIDAGKKAKCVAISDDGQTLALGLRLSTEFWDFESGRRLRTVKGGDSALSLDLSPDGRTLVCGRADGQIVPLGCGNRQTASHVRRSIGTS